jgi:hypothetical protein
MIDWVNVIVMGGAICVAAGFWVWVWLQKW